MDSDDDDRVGTERSCLYGDFHMFVPITTRGGSQNTIWNDDHLCVRKFTMNLPVITVL